MTFMDCHDDFGRIIRIAIKIEFSTDARFSRTRSQAVAAVFGGTI